VVVIGSFVTRRGMVGNVRLNVFDFGMKLIVRVCEGSILYRAAPFPAAGHELEKLSIHSRQLCKKNSLSLKMQYQLEMIVVIP